MKKRNLATRYAHEIAKRHRVGKVIVVLIKADGCGLRLTMGGRDRDGHHLSYWLRIAAKVYDRQHREALDRIAKRTPVKEGKFDDDKPF